MTRRTLAATSSLVPLGFSGGYDEASSDDESDGAGHWGGGRVATILVSSKVKPAYRSITHYHHESTLRLSLEALGLDENHWPGGAKNAPSMADFFLESRAFLGPK